MVCLIYCERLLFRSDVASAIELLNAIGLLVSGDIHCLVEERGDTYLGTWMAESESTKAMLPGVPFTYGGYESLTGPWSYRDASKSCCATLCCGVTNVVDCDRGESVL